MRPSLATLLLVGLSSVSLFIACEGQSECPTEHDGAERATGRTSFPLVIDAMGEETQDTSVLSVPDVSATPGSSPVRSQNECRSEIVTLLEGKGNTVDTPTSEDGFVATCNYAGAVKRIYGLNEPLPLGQGAQAETMEIHERIRASLSGVLEPLGVAENKVSLRFVRYDALRDGRRKYRFLQVLGDNPVLGGSVIVTLSADLSAIIAITSYAIPNILDGGCEKNCLAWNEPSNADLPSKVKQAVVSNLANQIPISSLEITHAERVHFVDRSSLKFETERCLLLKLEGETERDSFEALWSIESEELLLLRKGYDSADSVVYTQTTYPSYSATTCDSQNPCDQQGSHPYCFPDTERTDRCVRACSSGGGECAVMGAEWFCENGSSQDTSDPEFDGMCLTDEVDPNIALLVSVNYSFTPSYIYYNHYFSKASWLYWLYSYYVLYDFGRNGPDGQGASFVMYLGDYNNQTSDCASDDWIQINSWSNWSGDSTHDIAKRSWTIGHEGGHRMHRAIVEPGNLGHSDCVSENLADLYGALFARDQVTDSTWSYGGHTYSGWGDPPCGLDNGCYTVYGFGYRGNLPYSQRSRYDWVSCGSASSVTIGGVSCTTDADCPAYFQCNTVSHVCITADEHHNNSSKWLRFARLLSEGSGTFQRDGHNENIGLTFAGIGDAETRDIIYEATLGLEYDAKQSDLVEEMLAAGASQSPSRLTNVRYALGSCGFVGATFTLPAIVSTDRTPRAVKWPEWTQSSVKDVYVYRVRYQSSVRVAYHNGTQWTYVTLPGAATNHAPTALVHDGLLHVWWRDYFSGDIRGYVVDTSLALTYVDLGSKGIQTEGAFDAVEAFGDVFLGFVQPSDYTVSFAKCESQGTGCGASQYAEFWPGVFLKDAGYYASPGLGLVSSGDINGGASDEMIYVFTARPQQVSNTGQLRLLRVDDSCTVRSLQEMPLYYPGSTAVPGDPLGIDSRLSAFPTAGRYLYLTWKDASTSEVMASVVQDWTYYCDYCSAGALFTWPLGLETTPDDGVVFWRGDSSTSARHLHTTGAGQGRYEVIWGRY